MMTKDNSNALVVHLYSRSGCVLTSVQTKRFLKDTTLEPCLYPLEGYAMTDVLSYNKEQLNI